MKKLIVLGAAVAMLGATSFAAAGDAATGKVKAAACAACHGADGNSNINPEWPKLAGQHASYIAKQLGDFKKGEARSNALMASQVATLEQQDMEDLAAYFSSQAVTIGSADAEKAAAGKAIYQGGNKATGLPACMACHGPAGKGNEAAKFPSLSSQHAAYTTVQLKAFRAGSRGNDMNRMMRDVAAKMSDAEIDAVAAYISGLH